MLLGIKKLKYFILFIFCFSVGLSLAQDKEMGLSPDKKLTQYNLDFWDVEDGLPNNTVLDNLISNTGYLWIATFDGLVKFDGVNFTIYNDRTIPQFKKNGILCLYEDDSDGKLWVGSNGGGLISMDGETFKNYSADSTSLQRNIITKIIKDKAGFLWLATRKGVYKFKDEKFISVDFLKNIENSPIHTVFIDSNEVLWVGTLGEGLFRYEKGEMQHFTTENGLLNNSSREILEDSKGNIWIGTNDGIAKFENGKFTNILASVISESFFVNDMVEDSYGALWIATDIGIIRIYNGNIELLSTKNGLPDNNIQSLTFGNEGSLWIGNYRTGIGRIKNGKVKNFSVLEGLPNEVVNVVHNDDDKIWVGTDFGLASIVNDTVRSYFLGKSYQENRVRDILKDSKGNLWVCTYDGLIKFKNGKIVKRYTKKDGLPNNILRVIEEDREGNLWIGTGKKLSKFSNGKFVNYGQDDGLKNEFIMSIFYDSRNQLWVGTDGGGLHLLQKDDTFKMFNENDGLAANVVFQINEDKFGNIWIGSNGGLTRFDGRSFKKITYKEGLFSNTVFQVLMDRNSDYWIMTNAGVQKVKSEVLNDVMDGKMDKLLDFTTYNQSEGMRSSVITGASISVIGKNGDVLLPTFKGLSIINPNQVLKNNVKPPVQITKVRVNTKEEVIRDVINIPIGSESLEIHYTGISLYAPDEVRFKYKLEGFDKDWVDAGSRRVAYYTNLDAGDYVFRVKAANNDGVWNEEGAAISLHKKAFFYKTKAFAFAIILFLLLFIGFMYYLRTRTLRVHNAELQKMVAERTSGITKQRERIELQKEELDKLNAIKDKLISIVSHDLRGPINSFSGIVGLLSSGNLTCEESQNLAASVGGDINKVKNLMDNLLNWTKSQMQGIKLNQVVISLFVVTDETLNLFEIDVNKKNISLINNIEKHMMAFADLDMIKLILRNLVNNAIKFTPPKGEIIVSAVLKDEFVEVTVQDTGVGIDRDHIDKLFSPGFNYSMLGTSQETGSGLGLLLCKDFVEQNGGTIRVENNEKEGSSFKFTLLRN